MTFFGLHFFSETLRNCKIFLQTEQVTHRIVFSTCTLTNTCFWTVTSPKSKFVVTTLHRYASYGSCTQYPASLIQYLWNPWKLKVHF